MSRTSLSGVQILDTSGGSTLQEPSVADAIRSDLVNYNVALQQAARYMQELDITLGDLQREEELDAAMREREVARSSADERAIAARLRRASNQLQELDDRLAQVARAFPRPEDYERDLLELETGIAAAAREETEAMQELTKAVALLSVLRTRRHEARTEELRALERTRAEAEQLATRVLHRPLPITTPLRPGGQRLPLPLDHAVTAAGATGSSYSHGRPYVTGAPVSTGYSYRDPDTHSGLATGVYSSGTAGPTVSAALPPRRPSQPPPLRPAPGEIPTPNTLGFSNQVGAVDTVSVHGSFGRPLGPWLARQLQELLAAGAAPDALPQLRALIDEDRSLLWRVDTRGATPLHMACAAQPPSLAAVSLLVSAGASVRVMDAEGLTPFHVACLNRADLTGELKHFLLSSAGCDVNELTRDGATAAHLLAVDDRHLAAMRFLLRAGCDLAARANVGGGRWCTPAEVACLYNDDTTGRMQDLLGVGRRY